MYCTNCGAKIDDDEVFCSNCGEKLLLDEEQEGKESNVELQDAYRYEQRIAQENEIVIEANMESFRQTLAHLYLEKRKNNIFLHKKKPIKKIRKIHLIPILQVGKGVLKHKLFRTFFLPTYKWKWLEYIQLFLVGVIIGTVGYTPLFLLFIGFGLVVGIYLIVVMVLYEIEIRKYMNNSHYLS